MIIKSFETDKIKSQKNNIILLYGNNKGFKKEVINNFFINDYKYEILNLEEEDILNNQSKFIEELMTKSLFDEEKIIIVSNSSEKIFTTINEILEKKIEDIKIIINCNPLDKKSKLRGLFEKARNLTCIPFYEDNDRSLNIIAQDFFSKKKIKISQEIINLLIERSNGDRGNLKNELEKLENLYLTRKNFKFKDAEILTNLSENYSVFELSDSYLAKNSIKISRILNENNYSSEDCIIILRTILNKSKRLLKLKDEVDKNENIEAVLSTFKPPIFWKEKDIIKKQLQLWNAKEIKKIIYKISDIELILKKSSINSLNLVSDFVRNY